MNQQEKGARFATLHREGFFVLPNPWDAGSARMLAGMGFKALATTSAGLAFSLGRRDGSGLVSRAEALENATAIIAATDLPVSADLENGYGDTPEDAAETIMHAAAIGLVGASIEDATGDEASPIYDFGHAVERVQAAAEMAHAQAAPFTFAARAENFLHGRADLDDTIRRLQAYEAAGADVLYAPGLPSLEAIKTVVASVTKPINVLFGGKNLPYTLADLAAAGVRRASTGSGLYRAAMTGLNDAALELLGPGSCHFLDHGPTFGELGAMMAGKAE